MNRPEINVNVGKDVKPQDVADAIVAAYKRADFTRATVAHRRLPWWVYVGSFAGIGGAIGELIQLILA